MEGMASAFARLPGFNPMMMMNRSETCATRRLSQCTGYGVYENDISRKFDQDPEDVSDLLPEQFVARKAVLTEVADWCESMQGKKQQIVHKNEFVPILYLYEIVKSSAKRPRDWGHLIFTDLTISRFLLVMVFPPACNCGNLAHHDYEPITRYHADRFFSLAKYLNLEWGKGNSPNWVRATYVTWDSNETLRLNPDFLGNLAKLATTLNPPASPGKRPIYHVTNDNFIPTLLPPELEKIDNVVSQSSYAKRAAVSARDKVLGTKEDIPDVSSFLKERSPKMCNFCNKMSTDKDLQKCSRCKLVFYCGKECQRMAWPSHKHFCKQASAADS